MYVHVCTCVHECCVSSPLSLFKLSKTDSWSKSNPNTHIPLPLVTPRAPYPAHKPLKSRGIKHYHRIIKSAPATKATMPAARKATLPPLAPMFAALVSRIGSCHPQCVSARTVAQAQYVVWMNFCP